MIKLMDHRAAFLVTGIVGFLGIALGAFGAHALKGVLDAPRMAIWNTAVFYQLVHAPVLLWLAGRKMVKAMPMSLFSGGILLFSGSLYALALTNIHWLGIITPLGGVLLIAGWAWIAFAAYRYEYPQE